MEQIGVLRKLFTSSLVAGGQVARVEPDDTGLTPAWRNSLAYVTLGTGWKDGATKTQIDAARQLLIQDMKVLEGIAPDSGAYLNEVCSLPCVHPVLWVSDTVALTFSRRCVGF
jgi:hypothetical protein